MKIFITIMFMFIFSLAKVVGQLTSEGDTSSGLGYFYEQMRMEVVREEKRVQVLVAKLRQQGPLTLQQVRNQLSVASTNLDVKKTLVANFTGGVSLRSPLVRDRLLAVLRKERIEERDLVELKKLVAQVKGAAINRPRVIKQEVEKPHLKEENTEEACESGKGNEFYFIDCQKGKIDFEEF